MPLPAEGLIAGMADNRCVILFVKLPEQGKVKSRIARYVDGEMVLRLYECMVLDTIDVLKQVLAPFHICFDPPGSLDRAQNWLGQDYSYMPQTGDDLGERMEQAFVRVFSGGVTEALLIGSDIPGLPAAVIEAAFRALATHDAVLGPADDGGYYLIGFKKSSFYPRIFHEMLWSTGTVYRKTVERMHKALLSVHVLPQCMDVDTKEDLLKLLAGQHEQASTGRRTAQFLRQHRDGIGRAIDKALFL